MCFTNIWSFVEIPEYWGGEWKMLYNIDKCRHVHICENALDNKYEMGSCDNRITIKQLQSPPYVLLGGLGVQEDR